jgi:hypothetical protein
MPSTPEPPRLASHGTGVRALSRQEPLGSRPGEELVERSCEGHRRTRSQPDLPTPLGVATSAVQRSVDFVEAAAMRTVLDSVLRHKRDPTVVTYGVVPLGSVSPRQGPRALTTLCSRCRSHQWQGAGERPRAHGQSGQARHRPASPRKGALAVHHDVEPGKQPGRQGDVPAGVRACRPSSVAGELVADHRAGRRTPAIP